MAIREILVWPDPRLKLKAEPVAAVDDSVRKLCDDLADTMYDSKGVGLAATQIGALQRVIAMDVEQGSRDDDQGDEGGAPSRKGLFWLINPVVRLADGAEFTYREGCLSVPDEYEEITRPGHVIVDYLDRDGKKQVLEASDCLLSVCVQHEIDHLDGKVFVDYLSGLKRELIRRRMKKLKAARAQEKKGEAARL